MDKEKRQKRFQQKDRHINRQLSIKTKRGFVGQEVDQPHRLHKKSAWTCGNSNCVMCGNPRKFFSELTIQEKKQLEYFMSFEI